MDCSTPGFPVLHHLLEFVQVHVHWVDDAIQLSHPLLPPFLSMLNVSHHQGLFQWVSSSHQVAKVLELQLQLQHLSFQCWFPLWLIPFDLLAAQGTLKNLLQHHSSKISIPWHWAFFTVQFSHPYRTTRKNIALTRRTYVGKVMSLLFICCLGLS